MDSGDLGQTGAHAQCLVKVVSRGEAAAVITPRLGTVARTVLAYPEQQGAATSNLVQVVTVVRQAIKSKRKICSMWKRQHDFQHGDVRNLKGRNTHPQCHALVYGLDGKADVRCASNNACTLPLGLYMKYLHLYHSLLPAHPPRHVNANKALLFIYSFNHPFKCPR